MPHHLDFINLRTHVRTNPIGDDMAETAWERGTLNARFATVPLDAKFTRDPTGGSPYRHNLMFVNDTVTCGPTYPTPVMSTCNFNALSTV